MVDQSTPVVTVDGEPRVVPVKERRVMAPSVPRRNRSPGRVPTRDSGTGVPPARGMKAMRPWYS
jgi:hypothetical protein